MVRTKDELLERAKSILGDRTDDDAIGFVEDINDSYTDSENWHQKYLDNDAKWREKYRDRFFNSGGEEEPTNETEIVEQDKKLSYSDLFKTC